MNLIAEELNTRLEPTVVSELLSRLGKRLYFPNGIVAQAGQAGRARFNATAGVALSQGAPVVLSRIGTLTPSLTPAELVSYAPTLGDERIREYWNAHIRKVNPSLGNSLHSKPAVVPGLTSGIALTADLFADQDDTVILPHLSWDNYRLIFEDRRGASIVTFPLFDGDGRLDVPAFTRAVRSLPPGSKVITVFNFPHNPTGYSPLRDEADRLVEAVREAAETGYRLLVICDDAYFGLFFEKGICTESLFGKLAGVHENVLAVKVDGPTKEDFVWGFRLGFLTFGGFGLEPGHYAAMEEKLKGAIRSSFSSSSRTAQSILLRASASDGYEDEKRDKLRMLEERYREVKRVLSTLERPSVLTPLPFNSGYFLTFRVERGNAENLRLALLQDENTGTVSFDDRHLRIAWAAVETGDILPLFEGIYRAARRQG